MGNASANGQSAFVGRGGVPNPSRFNVYADPAAPPEQPNEARQKLNEELQKPSYPCKNKCGWATVVPNKLPDHEAMCDGSRAEYERRKATGSLGEEFGGGVGLSKEAVQQVVVDTVKATVTPMLQEFMANLTAALKPVAQVKQVKAPKKGRKSSGSTKRDHVEAESTGPAPISEMERTDTAMGAVSKQSDQEI